MVNYQIGDLCSVEKEAITKGKCGSFTTQYLNDNKSYIRVTSLNSHGPSYDILDRNGQAIGACACFKYEHLIPFNSSSFMSTLKEKFVLLTTKEPEKTYRKAGLVDGDNLLNDEGAKIFLTWLLGKNPEFKTEVADALVEEKEAK